MKTSLSMIFLITLSVVAGAHAYYLGEEQIGPDHPSQPAADQPEWPRGIVDLARQRTRVYSSWVNGNENFYFKVDAEGASTLLDLYAKAHTKDHDLLIDLEKGIAKTFKGMPIPYNIRLHVPSDIFLALKPDETVQMTLSLGDNPDLWKHIAIPENVRVKAQKNVRAALGIVIER